MTLALYDLATEHRAVFAAIEEANGELSPALEAALESIEAPFESKVEACAYKVREWTLTDAAIQAEIDRLKARQQSIRNSGVRLKEYVRECLDRAGVPRVETPRFTVSVQRSTPSARWVGDPDAIPAEYRREKVEVSFNAKAAIEDFRNDILLPEGVEIRQGTHLVIK